MYEILTRCLEAKGTEARGFNLGCSVSRIIVDTKRWHASYYSHRGQQPYIRLVESKGYHVCMYVCTYLCIYICMCCRTVSIFSFLTIRKYYVLWLWSRSESIYESIILYIYIYVYLCVFSLRIVGILVAYSNFGPRLYYLRI